MEQEHTVDIGIRQTTDVVDDALRAPEDGSLDGELPAERFVGATTGRATVNAAAHGRDAPVLEPQIGSELEEPTSLYKVQCGVIKVVKVL